MNEKLHKTESIVSKRKKYLVPCARHFYQRPPLLVKGRANYLYDEFGKEYLDMFSGVSVNHLGHCHPNITRAINEQIDKLGNVTTIYVTEPMVKLAEKLIGISSKSLAKVFFSTSDSVVWLEHAIR